MPGACRNQYRIRRRFRSADHRHAKRYKMLDVHDSHSLISRLSPLVIACPVPGVKCREESAIVDGAIDPNFARAYRFQCGLAG